MSKERPAEFDPHPGDPWHPDWAIDPSNLEAGSDENEAAWWRKALRRRSDNQVPDAYATLERTLGEPEAAPSAPVAPEAEIFAAAAVQPEVQAPIEAGTSADSTELDEELDSSLAAVARAFADGLSVDKEHPGTVTEAAPIATKADPAQEPAVTIDLRHLDDRRAADDGLAVGPVERPGPPPTAHEEEPNASATHDVETASAPTDEPLAVTPEQLEALAGVAHRRSKEYAAEMALVDRLALAEATAHEESAMWTAIASLRETSETSRDREQSDIIVRAPVDDSWAQKALEIEESRQRFDEARKRTEAEVRSALDRALASTPPTNRVDEATIAARFAAIAAQLHLEDAAEAQRDERAEELRLRTSLLVLDAEWPWRDGGQSRPGSTFGRGATILNSPSQVNLLAIATKNEPAVAESSTRRRWPWSRNRITSTVTVLEERPVSERDERGDEGQFELPLEDASVDTPFDLESAEGWDEWELEDAVEDSSLGTGADIEPAADSTPDDDFDDSGWEDFTAEQYVQTATREYADLADAVAAAEKSEAPEQAALAADMPGLESSLVGLEDVVAAEGLEAAEAAPRSDLALRVGTALALVILFFASLTYSWAIALLVIIVMVMAAGELATVLMRQSYHPVTLFAYLGTLGLLVGTWQYGLVAIPFTVVATVLVVLLYFGLVAGRDDPLTSMTLTLLSVLWVGVFASFAMDMVGSAEYRWLIGCLVVIVAVMDMAQYFVGKRWGKRPLAPIVSPKKTVAGLVGGVAAAVGTGFGLSFIAPFDQVTGIVLGAVLAATGPVGDLAVSVLKRTLGVKDMGTILPGHGGILDRIDAILFSLPAAWLVYSWASLLA